MGKSTLSESPNRVYGREVMTENSFVQTKHPKYPIWRLIPKEKKCRFSQRHNRNISFQSNTSKKNTRSNTPTPDQSREYPSPGKNIDHLLKRSLKKERDDKRREAHSAEREKIEKEKKIRAFLTFNKNTRLDNFKKFKHEQFIPNAKWNFSSQENRENEKQVVYKKKQRILRKKKNNKIRSPAKKTEKRKSKFTSPKKTKTNLKSFVNSVVNVQSWLRQILAEKQTLALITDNLHRNVPMQQHNSFASEEDYFKEPLGKYFKEPLDGYFKESSEEYFKEPLEEHFKEPSKEYFQEEYLKEISEEDSQMFDYERKIEKYINFHTHKQKAETELTISPLETISIPPSQVPSASYVQKLEAKNEELKSIFMSQLDRKLIEKNYLPSIKERDMSAALSHVQSHNTRSKIKTILERRYDYFNLLIDEQIDTIAEALEIEVHSHSESDIISDEEPMILNTKNLLFKFPETAEPELPEIISHSESEEQSDGEELIQINLVSEFIINRIEVVILEDIIRSANKKPKKRGAEGAFVYFEKVLKEALKDKKGLENALLTPVKRDPLERLSQIQQLEIGSPCNFKTPIKPVISSEVFWHLENKHSNESYKTENRMIFDAINESFAQKRVHGLNGDPMPWQSEKQFYKKKIDSNFIVKKVKEDMIEWCFMEAGKIQDGYLHESELELLREETAANMLALELIDFDNEWTNYEFEEDQVKIDLGDVLLEDLVCELFLLI